MKFYGQLSQDKWIITKVFPNRRKGYFVDIGASNGIDISNTFLLEKHFEWRGICVEPGLMFDQLKRNRKCSLDNSCISDTSGQRTAFKVDQADPDYSGILDQIDTYAQRNGNIIFKKTKTLYELLIEYKAPKNIDFLSIDTEGSEYLILKNFPFSEYTFGAITVEHNHVEPKRSQLYNLLTSNGYFRAFTVKYDDWYLRRNSANIVKHFGEKIIRKLLRLGSAF